MCGLLSKCKICRVHVAYMSDTLNTMHISNTEESFKIIIIALLNCLKGSLTPKEMQLSKLKIRYPYWFNDRHMITNLYKIYFNFALQIFVITIPVTIKNMAHHVFNKFYSCYKISLRSSIIHIIIYPPFKWTLFILFFFALFG